MWYKSSRSDGGNACVEVCHTAAATLVRDTKDNGRGPILEFPADVWTDFIDSGIWKC
ncbi:DUF397 domain-containing protein [Nocardia sp. CT2-14]|uniref:DUF397 domain-containing protein n=2 Tax=Nocardia aurantiaca TaxID=2675850 RepID=A0A6I3KY91_9NOCA|nr:DUF397 domain-containing protein [Nocardia aurantiaca]